MTRTTITLPDDLASAAKREARRRHTSVSALAREALSDLLGLNETRPRDVPFAAIVSDADPRHTAERMEDALEEVIDEAYHDAFGGSRR